MTPRGRSLLFDLSCRTPSLECVLWQCDQSIFSHLFWIRAYQLHRWCELSKQYKFLSCIHWIAIRWSLMLQTYNSGVHSLIVLVEMMIVDLYLTKWVPLLRYYRDWMCRRAATLVKVSSSDHFVYGDGLMSLGFRFKWHSFTIAVQKSGLKFVDLFFKEQVKLSDYSVKMSLVGSRALRRFDSWFHSRILVYH
mgnify:CR=1 FL=1